LSASECIEMIKKAGGIAVAAHLHLTKLDGEALRAFLVNLKAQGLDGIEGYYTDYTPQMQADYGVLARELDLCISGGTDFHGEMKPHIAIGTGLGNMSIPYSVLEGIRERLQKS
ncbi:MAG TPA: PHP domain-containing protein, partial [Clostridiales bacterium]|nr:PHP domain-containing protein [Clostridiales bacterium]